MMLADHGAEVIRIERPGEVVAPHSLARGRRSIAVDLKSEDGIALVRKLCGTADGLIEGFRPGVMERLGLGPDAALGKNPKLVYGRMTGWGQDGPLAPRAGHDINYIALAGVLQAFGRKGEAPVPPLNLVGDFGGGGMFLAFGVVSALLEAQRSGKGQVVDAAMVDGAALLAAMFSGFLAAKQWSEERGTNVLDTGAPWYDVYETADGKYVAIGAIEDKFFAELGAKLKLIDLPPQYDRSRWPEMRRRIAEAFRARTREEWCRIFAGSDACFAPVLSWSEAREHEHSRSRKSYTEVAGVAQPSPAPRFSRTAAQVRRPPPERGQGGAAALREWGFTDSQIESLGFGTRE
jgi:alpha-methylacyl-CoA racemase